MAELRGKAGRGQGALIWSWRGALASSPQSVVRAGLCRGEDAGSPWADPAAGAPALRRRSWAGGSAPLLLGRSGPTPVLLCELLSHPLRSVSLPPSSFPVEVKFIYHKISYFKVNNSMSFEIFTMLFDIFTPKGALRPLSCLVPSSPTTPPHPAPGSC